MRNALKQLVLAGVAMTFVGCGAARLDPERIAANIQLQPSSMQLQLGDDLAHVGIVAGVQACNRNDVDVEVVEATWVAELAKAAVGNGTVRGPVTLVAQKCQILQVDGHVDLTRAGVAALAAIATGQPLSPVLLVDLTAGVWGLHSHRKVRLEGFDLGTPRVVPEK